MCRQSAVACLFVSALLCFVVLWRPVQCTERKLCGENLTVPVLQGTFTACISTYNISGAGAYFIITNDDCFQFTMLNFTLFGNDWATDFNNCANDMTLLLNTVTPGNGRTQINLLSSQCQQYDERDSLDDCNCRMDCLLKFQFSSFSFVFFKGITCDLSEFNSAISIYEKSPNLMPSFIWKYGYPVCTNETSSTPSPSLSSPSSSTIMATSIAMDSITQSSTSSNTVVSSSLILTPSSTVVPVPSVVCLAGFEMRASNTIYCSNTTTCSSNTSFGRQYNQSCQLQSSPNTTSSYYYTIKLHSSSTCSAVTNSFTQPSNGSFSLLRGALVSTTAQCSNGGWNITRASCQCHSSGESCSLLTTTTSSCTSSCLIEFTHSNNNNIIYTLFTDLTDTQRRALLTTFTTNNNSSSQCNSVINSNTTNCCTTTATATIGASAYTPVTSATVGIDNPLPFYREVYFLAGVSAGVGFIIILLLSSLFLCLIIKGRRKNRKKFSPSVISPLERGGVEGMGSINGKPSPLTSISDSTLVFSPAVLEPPPVYGKPVVDYTKWKLIFSSYIINYSQLTSMETIGEGAFGLVQKGVLIQPGNTQKYQVAIKSMKDASVAEQVEDFMSESAIMLDFDHPNVLKLLGVCFDTPDRLPVIVLPYMANGDLKSFLQSKRRIANGGTPDGLNIPLLTRMCLDICQGMEYLSKKKFVHRDLAARNCMIDEELFVKVADFGLSRDIYSRDYYRLERRAKLPVKWLPPESLHDNIYNEKTDVWSFGVTCWEVFSLGKTPYPALDNADVLDYIDKGIRLGKPRLCPKEMYLILSQCWDQSPEVRPSFTDLVERIRTVHSNWLGLTSSLQLKMEQLLLSEYDEKTGSSCAEVTLFNIHQRGSSSSSVTTPTTPSQRKLSTNSNASLVLRPKEPSCYILPSPQQGDDSPSQQQLNDYSHLQHKNRLKSDSSIEGPRPVYSTLSSQPLETQFESLNERMGLRQPSLENFGRTLDRRGDQDEEIPVPLFELLYDTSSGITGGSAGTSQGESLSASLEEPNNDTQKPQKTLSTDNSNTYSPLVFPNNKYNKNRSSSKSSTAPLLCSTSTTASHFDSSPPPPTDINGHYYFTLDRPVFGDDTDGSDSEDKTGGAKIASKGKSPSPVLLKAYETPVVAYKGSVPNTSTTVLPPHSLNEGEERGRGLSSTSSLLGSNQIPLKQFLITETSSHQQ